MLASPADRCANQIYHSTAQHCVNYTAPVHASQRAKYRVVLRGPSPFPPHPLPSTLSPLLPVPSPFTCLSFYSPRTLSKNPARERCKLHQRGLGWSPQAKSNFVHYISKIWHLETAILVTRSHVKLYMEENITVRMRGFMAELGFCRQKPVSARHVV